MSFFYFAFQLQKNVAFVVILTNIMHGAARFFVPGGDNRFMDARPVHSLRRGQAIDQPTVRLHLPCRGAPSVEHGDGPVAEEDVLRRELVDLAEGFDVTFRDDEQVRIGLRIDVADRDKTRTCAYVLALTVEAAEETIVRQRGSPPP